MFFPLKGMGRQKLIEKKPFFQIATVLKCFFNSYLAAPQPTLGHYRGGSLTHPILNIVLLHTRP